MAINFQYYPKSMRLPSHLEKVVNVFNEKDSIISSNNRLKSNEVLNITR